MQYQLDSINDHTVTILTFLPIYYSTVATYPLTHALYMWSITSQPTTQGYYAYTHLRLQVHEKAEGENEELTETV